MNPIQQQNMAQAWVSMSDYVRDNGTPPMEMIHQFTEYIYSLI